MLVKARTTDSLLESYEKGCSWVTSKMQVTGTDKNREGKTYNHENFLLGLRRLKEIEDELRKRGVTL